ncbi:chaplin [Streptomyces sp. NPDC000983]|uniref:chaplin n=1 Tax=Streptomyces sp. NPDC000983 TaxID=3154373 RepID=UPI003333D257
MRQVTRKGLMTVAAATGVIAAAGGTAQAHSGASGAAANSPGVLSGNTVQVPVHVPVNACGNTVDVVGILNPAVGNTCVNRSVGAHGGYGDADGHSGGHSGGSGGSGGAHSGGHASDSPGVGSGNHVEVPVHAPVNVCGNSVDVIGIGNGTTGNDCANDGGGYGGSGGGGQTRPGGDGGGHGGEHGGGGGGHNPPGSGHENPGGPSGNPDDRGNPGDGGSPDDRGNGGGGTASTSGGTHPDGTPLTDGPGTHSVAQSSAGGLLAATGAELPLGLALPVGAGAVLAGAVLYRRARAAA